MGYWFLDNEEGAEGPVDEDEWIPLGEALSEGAVQLMAVTLFELGVPCHWAEGGTDVDDLRRVLEPGTAGKVLLVQPPDVERAMEAVHHNMGPLWFWADVETYLLSRPTDDVLKILDSKKIWPQAIQNSAKSVLRTRGTDYPPDGDTSNALPFFCFLMGMWLGPLAAFMRWWIDKARQMPSGGQRPVYAEATQKKANVCLFWGVMIWVMIAFCAIMMRSLG